MKQFYAQILLIFLIVNLHAQSIRKNYLEMTDDEKVDLVNALYQLRTGPDLFNDLAAFHGNYFVFDNTDDPNGLAIHLNLPDRPDMDIFFSWHRSQMFELEQAMQEINPNLSLPYWDTVTDQSVNSPLWDQNFLGQFDSDWNLGRDLGASSGPLPTSQDVIIAKSNSDFLLFSNAIERGSAHTGAHRWVGGVMRTGRSPRDPAFYFHHANVDRLWAEWQEVNQNSTFQRTSMLRYDGTYVFDGEVLPLVNPNDIIDTRYYGTFYALNGFVMLDNYTVSNSYNGQENFYYQFTIQAGDNFIVPSGTDCKFESVNEIILKPGFEAQEGSFFIAKTSNMVSKNSLSKRGNEIVRNQIPFDDFEELYNIYDIFDKVESKTVFFEPFPNPFNERITIEFSEIINKSEVIIYDLMGRIVKRQNIYQLNRIEISNLENLSSGIYIVHIVNQNNGVILNKKIVKI